MSVVARFYVQSTEPQPGSTANRVSLGAVCRGAHNAEWSSATPCGSISMYIRNDAAFEQFAAGKEYEVTFREVKAAAPGDGHEVRPYVNSAGWTSCGECGAYPKGQDRANQDTSDFDWSAHDAS